MLLIYYFVVLFALHMRHHGQLLREWLLDSCALPPAFLCSRIQLLLYLKLLYLAGRTRPLPLLLDIQHPREVIPIHRGFVWVELPIEEIRPLFGMKDDIELQRYFAHSRLEKAYFSKVRLLVWSLSSNRHRMAPIRWLFFVTSTI